MDRSDAEIEEAARVQFVKMVLPIDGLNTGPFTYYLAGYRAALGLEQAPEKK